MYKWMLLNLLFVTPQSFATVITYHCKLTVRCESTMGEDRVREFDYSIDTEKKAEPVTVELADVKARVFAPHYLSLYLFSQKNPEGAWTKTHSSELVNKLELCLVIPGSYGHNSLATLACNK